MTQFCRLLGLLLLCGCLPNQGVQVVSAQAERCSVPENTPTDPQSIDEAVALINALPKPVTLACFVESLARPMRIQATSSDFSLQPAEGESRPRIFIVRGRLVMSIVASDRPEGMIEFGERVADGRSVKAAIAFPVLAPLNADGAYATVRRGSLTTCSGCHSHEAPLDEVARPGVFVSTLLSPLAGFEVDLERIIGFAKSCDPAAEPRRCGILRAIAGDGHDVQRATF